MKKIIIANLKMNFTQEETKRYLDKLLPNSESLANKLAVCFPYTNLSLASDMLFGKKVLLGAQNVHHEDSGSYTGEISAKMLSGFSCKYVLVGHSERRKHETNKEINEKIKALLKYGMKAVLCVGETLKERETSKTKSSVKQQIEQALFGLYENELKNVVIAYEPVWAIGSGKTPTAKQVQQIAEYIRDIIKQNFSEKASKNITILYGGSIKPENCKTFLTIDQIDGALVGGASLNPDLLVKIANFK